MVRYYQLFAMAYSASLALADDMMVNGTWTKNHIDTLLSAAPITSKYKQKYNSKDKGENPSQRENGVPIVYPPCNTESLQSLDLSNRERIILSVAQFRCGIHVRPYP